LLLIYLGLAWIAGIALGSVLDFPPFIVFFGLAPLVLLLFIRRGRKIIVFSGVCLALFLSGVVYCRFRLPLTPDSIVSVGWIDNLRNSLSLVLDTILPEPQAALAQGTLLGIRSSIPAPVQADFVHTGTAHILAISGQNLSIMTGILVSFGIWVFGKKHYFYIWLALGILWIYTLLTGFQPPVVRGAVMASVFLFADLLGRQHSAFTSLVFAAAVMVGISPGVLGSASFQMSFTAMAGLIFIYSPLQSLARKVVTARLGENGAVVSGVTFVVDSLCVSLAAVMAVWPLIAYYFGIISWIGPVATIFGVPSLPGIIVSGALAGVAGLIALPVSQVFGWVTWLFLSYLLLVVKIFSFVPFTSGLEFGYAFVWIYYAVLAVIIWLGHNKPVMSNIWKWLQSSSENASGLLSRVPFRVSIPSLSVIAVLVWLGAASVPDDNLHAAFLDVGQGDSVLFQKGSRQVLVDGGPDEQAVMLALGREMPFWDRTIDLVILTHPHADHLSGLLAVLERYKVGQVLYPLSDDNSTEYREWLALISGKNIKYTYARNGQEIQFTSGVNISVLNPPDPPLTGTASDIDNNGVVVRLETGEISFLITGDIEREGELNLMTRRAVRGSTVLKVAHHASETSTSAGFLGTVRPDAAVISVGRNNPYGHPNAGVLTGLSDLVGTTNIYRTDVNGTIRMTTDGKKLWVRKEK
jgi:competence protein ComEC